MILSPECKFHVNEWLAGVSVVIWCWWRFFLLGPLVQMLFDSSTVHPSCESILRKSVELIALGRACP